MYCPLLPQELGERQKLREAGGMNETFPCPFGDMFHEFPFQSARYQL
jgi:hypothetical protein